VATLTVGQVVCGHVHLALPKHHVAGSVALDDLNFLLFLALQTVAAFLSGNRCRLRTLTLEPAKKSNHKKREEEQFNLQKTKKESEEGRKGWDIT